MSAQEIHEVKKELAAWGINPNDAFQNDNFCKAFTQFKRGNIDMERLVEVADIALNVDK